MLYHHKTTYKQDKATSRFYNVKQWEAILIYISADSSMFEKTKWYGELTKCHVYNAVVCNRPALSQTNSLCRAKFMSRLFSMLTPDTTRAKNYAEMPEKREFAMRGGTFNICSISSLL
jgi:hypothetical protein